MAEGEKKKRSPLPIILGLVLIVVALVVVIWFTRPQAENPTVAPPPEMGPDTVQANPADVAPSASAAPQTAATEAPAVGAASADAIVTTAAAATPSRIAFEDESLSFSATLPEGPPADPVLAYLRKDAENYLARVKANARADFNRLKKAGEKPRPWEVRIKWTYTAKADGVVSLAGEASEYTGGAHPNLMFDTFVGRTTGEKLIMADMLILQRSPSPALTIAICEALKSAKIVRIKAATIFDEPIVCAGPKANAKTDAAKIALAPSNQPERFGGLYAYYDPYSVGAYVEGPYILTVQQGVFAEDLRPEFKKLFAGEAPVL